ncbi:MAG: hypothetical protein RL187_921, partial [Actinomycetota bacterium]
MTPEGNEPPDHDDRDFWING